jgi:hypothetical protein
MSVVCLNIINGSYRSYGTAFVAAGYRSHAAGKSEPPQCIKDKDVLHVSW